MALNVTGFPLEFDAVINTDTLELGIKSTTDNIDALLKRVEASALKTDKVFLDLKKDLMSLMLLKKYSRIRLQNSRSLGK